jgi:protein TonB
MRRPRGPRLLVFARQGALAGGVASVVFTGARIRERHRFAVAVGVALLAYAGAGAWALTRSHDRVLPASPRPPEMTVELLASPPPVAPPVVLAHSAPAVRALRALSVTRAAPLGPSRAAEVVAREAPADEPVDLTDFSIATGTATRFAGGDTASNGTSTHAVTGAVANGVRDGSGSDLSRPVSISDTEWSDCAWPPEADALGIDEQVVSMVAVAGADGRFESAEILSDPGHGFGAALLACARRHGFIPARDRGGRPVRARSGTLRFTFTR